MINSLSIYDCYPDPEFAKKTAFKPFRLIDLTVLSDEEISQHGLAALMEMLFKHQRDKDFLSIMRKMLQSRLVQNVIKELNISYLNDMLNYIVTTTQDETEPKAAQHLIQDLIRAFPDETARKSIMTFAQQLKQEGLQQGLQQGLQRGLEQGFEKGITSVAKIMRYKGLDQKTIEEILSLSKKELEQEEV
jgi:predicted transposase/invertase (TIGR01784 family)